MPVPLPALETRPYFVPDGVDYESLPDPVRRALIAVIGPAYQELVDRAPTALERSVGVSLVFLLTMEVLDQFEVAKHTDFTTLSPADRTARGKLIDTHLQLISAKQAAARFMFRAKVDREHPNTGTLSRLPRR